MSRAKRLAGFVRRIARLKSRIRVDQIELNDLEQRAGFLRASMAVDAMPETQRNILVQAFMPMRVAEILGDPAGGVTMKSTAE